MKAYELLYFVAPSIDCLLYTSTQGVHVMNVADKDKVTAVAIATSNDKKASKTHTSKDQMNLLDQE